MVYSYSLNEPPTSDQVQNRRVFVTGAAGRIGSSFAEHGAKKYTLQLAVRPGEDQKDIDRLSAFGEVVEVDLSDLPRYTELCRGIDTVVHLAGDPSPSAKWDDLLNHNIVGTYNVMRAAKTAGCRRVVYASSIHAVGGYPADIQVKTSEPPNPGDLYGVSKCFGESLGRYMTEQEGLSVIALRIGAFQPTENVTKEDGLPLFDCWISPRDLNQLIELCIENTRVRWAIFHALSNNTYNHLDISDARELLGYKPQDDAATLIPGISKFPLREQRLPHASKDRHD